MLKRERRRKRRQDTAHAVPVSSPAWGLGRDVETSLLLAASLFQPDAETPGAIKLRRR